MSTHLNRFQRAALTLAVVPVAASLASCDLSGTSGAAPGASDASTAPQTTGAAAQTAASVVTLNVGDGEEDVRVDTRLSAVATDGVLKQVSVDSAAGAITGTVRGDTWTADQLLEPGTTYRVRTLADAADGTPVRTLTRFRTQALTLDEQTYASIAPLDGETVGVGMPVIVTFDVPVSDRASMEKHMSVTSTPAQSGSWHWLSDTEVHWRPRTYWKAGTDVHVAVDVNSIPAGNGIYGQEDREVDFHVGDAHIYKVDARTHQMRVFSNGRLLRTIPITTGKPGFTTRSGVKVIIEKFASKRMNSETVGITGSEAYDLDNVQWAMRLTYSGEFIHAAPWSVGSQGYANVSHGCTGMSTANAAWLYDLSRRGDVVETTGTDRPMTLDNGYGDWNASYASYAKASALR